MKLFEFKTTKEYEKAMLQSYQSDPYFLNNKSGIFHIVCNPKGAFYRNTIQKMIGVKSGSEILCQCVLIKHFAFDGLMMAFFEAKEEAWDAVHLMTKFAADFGRKYNLKRMVVAMDGHCNYSLGFSCGDSTAFPLFGESYNPDYYHAYFQKEFRTLGFSGFWRSFKKISAELEGIMSRIGKRMTDIQTRCSDMRDFRNEIRRYTDLSNQIFDGHWYYFHREYQEDWELFQSMKPLLAPCNLIFVQKGGKDIGYLLFYPDFNEMVSKGKEVGVGTFFRHKLLRQPIRTVKIVEIAVLSKYRSSGAIIALFAEACRQIKRNYPHVERVVSSWILDDNAPSKNITTRFAPHSYGSYCAYEKEI
jgi:hypothetical protein